MNDIVFRIGGEGGEGVISTGELLTRALARADYEIYTFRTYPAEIKGGHANFQVRVSDRLLLSQGDKLDVLLAFNQEAYDRHFKFLKVNGVLLYDSDSFSTPPGINSCIGYGVPLTKIAVEQIGLKFSKNIIALGVLSELFNIPLEKFEGLISEKFKKKGEEVYTKNIQALEAGFDYAAQHVKKVDSYRLEPVTHKRDVVVMTGNEAMALGAVAAGLKVYAGYPITPATDIMEWLARELPKVGGVVVQTEDEIAAIGTVLGASFAGKKAMTATAGPGLSLMTEFLGLATMTEIPCVVIDCQRGGPSTGLPTKTEQGDLNLALYGGHGDSPRVVIALTSVADCFQGIIRAINIAEEYQMPVIVLSDQYLAHRMASVERSNFESVEIKERLRPTPAQLAGYKRYALTETGVSPMAIPGDVGGFYTATGLEHDEAAELSFESQNHEIMTEKRHRKLRMLEKTSNEAAKVYGLEQPEIAIIGWGSSEGVIREAVERAQEEKMPVGALHPKLLKPFPTQRVQTFLKKAKVLIIPEINFTGQFASLLRAHVSFEPIAQLNKCGGLPFAPEEILAKIKEVRKHG